MMIWWGFTRLSEPAAKALRVTYGRLNMLRVEAVTTVIPDCEFGQKRAVGVYTIEVVVQAS